MELETSNRSSQGKVNQELFYLNGDLLFERNPILILNENLDNLHMPVGANEQAIENFLQNLEVFDPPSHPVYWLMMSRLFELATICAGHYADNCEFFAARALLVNPRKVLIHRKGCPTPLIKQRHGRLSEQLSNEQNCKEIVLLQVKHEVRIENLEDYSDFISYKNL